ncbi:MAG: hypothetical protein KF889_12905 [Alphaproteobacteria bacterium]|nr:hypothetical protein [Alphaproteobacteria bacterium]MCW5739106.1 hypothetical protein [Alphaproteobacteria bacterium]
MATAKLHINLTQGLIEAEGDETFVRVVYDDFKERLRAQPAKQQTLHAANKEGEQPNAQDTARRPKARRRAAAPKTSTRGEAEPKGSAGGMTSYEPRRLPDLDLSHLADFVKSFTFKGNPERYVVYTQFLKEKLQIEPCTIDHLYSCFDEMKDTLPTNMGQNLVDTRLRNSFLKFTTPQDIQLTVTGINHYNKMLRAASK